MSDAQLNQPGQAAPALSTTDNLDNRAPATAEEYEANPEVPSLVSASAPEGPAAIDRAPSPEKRVIHSTASPPPTKKAKMSHSDAVTEVQKQPSLLVKKLTENARAPTRGSAFAAGYDMYASEACVIPKGGKGLVETGLSMAVPDGCYGRIAPRSGLASKNFIDTGAGVIDADYRGPVKILLFNHSGKDFEVSEGDRVAQLILERIYTPEVEVVENLEESVRGAGGFGSSGK